VQRLCGLVLFVAFVSGCAPGVDRPAASAASRAVVSEASVRGHLQFLASDALNGRGSGTRDEWITATYVAAHFERIGLQPLRSSPGFVHEIRVERSSLAGPPSLTFGERVLTHAKEMLVTSFSTPRITAALQKYQAGAAVSGGAAVLLPRTNLPSAAQTSPAAVVLSLETEAQQKRRLAGLAAPGPPLRMQWIVGTPRRAAIALDERSYEAIASLSDGTAITLEAETHAAELTTTWNVVGQLAGRREDQRHQLIVLSAHHDHVGSRGSAIDGGDRDLIFNGADDDASGVVAVLELAQALSRQPVDRTLVFATFGSEETGGQGSTHFLETSGLNFTDMVTNLQFEMIGRPDPKVPAETLWLTGYERSNLGEALARRGARLVADPHPEQSFFTRSDNIRFARRGIVAHTVSSYGMHDDYHQPTDEIDAIDFGHLTRAIASLVRPIRWLANGDFTPEWKAGMRP
jgi:aminopeptidase YwaD